MSRKVPSCPICGYNNNAGYTWRKYVKEGIYECMWCNSMFLEELLDFGTDECDHEWIKTGLRKSWCKKCDSTGYFNIAIGDYE